MNLDNASHPQICSPMFPDRYRLKEIRLPFFVLSVLKKLYLSVLKKNIMCFYSFTSKPVNLLTLMFQSMAQMFLLRGLMGQIP